MVIPYEDQAHTILTNQTQNDRSNEQKTNDALETLLRFSIVDAKQFEDISTLRSTGATTAILINEKITEESLKRKHNFVNCTDFHASTYKDRDGTLKSVEIRRKDECVMCRKFSGWFRPICLTSNTSHVRYWCCKI